jgi:gamma-F420-2:alpha-L-glutamate ligase
METKRIWVLNRRDRIGLYQTQRVNEEAALLNIIVDHVVAEDFEICESHIKTKTIIYKGEKKALPDAVLTRQTGMTYFAHALLRHFHQQGVFVANRSETIDNAEDKFKTTQLLAAQGIPIPKSMLVQYPLNIQAIRQEIGFPLVLKTVLGTKGQGVLLFHTQSEFEENIGLLQRLTDGKQQLIVQEFVESSKGTDLRVFVVGNKAIGCVQRRSADPSTQFKANVALGGSAEYKMVDPEIEKIAVQSSQALGLDLAGVDLLFDINGYKVCEVNSAPSFEGFEKDAGVNVPRSMLQYLLVHI